MRVTNNMRQEQLLRSLTANAGALSKAQEQVSTGKRWSRPSEDPVAASQVMRSDRGLRAIEQYRRNSTAARTRLDAEEAATDQLGEVLSRARVLGTGQATATANQATRDATAAELDQLIAQAIQLGNTKVGDTYIFGGFQTGAPPFQSDGSYVGDDGQRQAEIGDGFLMPTNHTGRQLFVDTGALKGLQDLRDALRAGNQGAIETATGAVATAFDGVQVSLAEVGARTNQLDSAAQNLTALQGSLEERNVGDQGITLEEATMKMLTIQNTLQAAYAATGKIMSLSLTEYLR